MKPSDPGSSYPPLKGKKHTISDKTSTQLTLFAAMRPDPVLPLSSLLNGTIDPPTPTKLTYLDRINKNSFPSKLHTEEALINARRPDNTIPGLYCVRAMDILAHRPTCYRVA
jgi:hypothetical protein